MLPESFADLGNHMANAVCCFVALEVLAKQVFFGIPKPETDLFVNACIAPNGEVVRFFGQINQYAISGFGIEHPEQLEYFGRPFHRVISHAKVFHEDAYLSRRPAFSRPDGLYDAGFFFFCEKHFFIWW